MNTENDQLRDRIRSLEKRVQDQDDEIICLKSAIADCLRRLQTVEAIRGNTNFHCSILNLI